MSRFFFRKFFASRQSATEIPDGNDQPLTSQFDGQRFVVGRGDSSTVDGAPVLTIENDDVRLRNDGQLSTLGDTATVEINGDDARIENRRGGSIEAEDTGILVNGDDARIDNAGVIQGGVNGVRVASDGSGSATILNRGIIKSDSRAVDIDGEGTTLFNSGLILGTGDQRNGTVYADDTAEDYNIINSRRGIIDAGAGNEGAGISLSLDEDGAGHVFVYNDGQVAGRGDASAGSATAGDGIRLESIREGGALVGNEALFEGIIKNSGQVTSEGANGTVGAFRSVNGVDFQGTLVNQRGGLFAGEQNGVYFGTGDHSGGLFFNRGVVTSDSRAVNIDGEDLSVVNSGLILGTGDQRNGTVYADDTAEDYSIVNTRRGTIDAGADNEGAGISLSLDADGADDVFVHNAGRVSGRGDASAGSATAGDGIRLEGIREGGALVGNEALFEGTIRNSGQVTSEGANGTVGAFRSVNGVDFQGTLINERGGTFAGGQNGVYFGTGDHSDGSFVNRGTVTSDSRAVNIDGEGLSVVNSGRILGTGDQRNGTVYADDTAEDFSIANFRRGTIDAGRGNEGAGISLSLDADGAGHVEVYNDGRVAGRGDAAAGLATAGDGIRLEGIREGGALVGNQALFEGTIRNSGHVTSEGANGTVGAFRSVNGVDFQGSLVNERGGVFAGGQNGVYFGTGDHSDGSFVNNGLVTSDSRAVNIDGEGLSVVNNGHILGTGDQRNGTVYADSTAEDYSLYNTRHGLIDAGRHNDGSGIALQTGDVAGDIVSASVVNDGVVRGRGDAESANQIGHGLRVFSGSGLEGQTTFQGDIVNNGLIAGSTASALAAGIIIEDGVTLDGTIVNNGRIVAEEVAIDTREAGPVAVENNGRLDGDVLLGDFDDSFAVGEGGRVDGSVDGGQGNDTLDLSGLDSGVVVDLDLNSAGAAGTPSQEGALLTAKPSEGGKVVQQFDGFENVVGTDFDDVLLGNNEVNVLRGGDGDDAIHSFGGADIIDGGEGTDTALFTASPGVTVDLDDDGNAVLASGEELISIENLTGSASGSDHLTGNAGVNVLSGQGGNDVLAGEGGSDTFVFEQGTDQDVVTDFEASDDLLDLTDFGFESVEEVQEAAIEGLVDGQVATTIDLDGGAGGDQVTLLGVAVTDLNSGNVLINDEAYV